MSLLPSDGASELHLETLGVFVHGILFGLHALGLAHNIRKRKHLDILMHASAAAYDLWAVSTHLRSVNSLQVSSD